MEEDVSKVLVLGAEGMAGHMIAAYLQRQSHYQVVPAARSSSTPEYRFDAAVPESVETLVREQKPDHVVNCVGLLVRQAADNPAMAIKINAEYPHQLALLAASTGFRLVHMSTDCVFSGRDGPYVESDPTDALDVYGKSKALGEISAPGVLTIRTSIIGPEISRHQTGLFHWFMEQRGPVRGFTRAIWSGVTTLELARAVVFALEKREISGIAHLTNNYAISKYNLLRCMVRVWDRSDVTVVPDSAQRVDKSIVSTREDFDYEVPDYYAMLSSLRDWIVRDADRYPAYVVNA